MSKTQYLVGKKWEDEVLDYYVKRGYFGYKMPTMNVGTVFDFIFARSGGVLFVECKHITGDKLYYHSSGLKKKTDEIEHFIKTTNNNIYIYVKSDVGGIYWTTWVRSSALLKEKGYLHLDDMFKANLGDSNEV